MAKRQISAGDAMHIEAQCQRLLTLTGLIATPSSHEFVTNCIGEIRAVLSRQVLIVDNNYNDGRLTTRHRVQLLQRNAQRERAICKRKQAVNVCEVICNVCSNAAQREVKHRAPECKGSSK